jgi:hypothetical protein
LHRPAHLGQIEEARAHADCKADIDRAACTLGMPRMVLQIGSDFQGAPSRLSTSSRSPASVGGPRSRLHRACSTRAVRLRAPRLCGARSASLDAAQDPAGSFKVARAKTWTVQRARRARLAETRYRARGDADAAPGRAPLRVAPTKARGRFGGLDALMGGKSVDVRSLNSAFLHDP